MIYKVFSEVPKERIAEELATAAKEEGFGVLGSYPFREILESKGFPIEREITVYELCNPPGAQSALEQLPEISVYLPCRLSLYEEGGQTVLATIGFEDILGAVEVSDDLRNHFEELFLRLKRVMKHWSPES